MKHMGLLAVLATCAGLAAMPASATLITTRAGLGGNDVIDWAQLGPTFFLADDPSHVQSDNGFAATVRGAGEGLERLRAFGDFGGDDELVGTFGLPKLSIEFEVGIRAIGAQIQDIGFDESFLGLIRVFDGLGNLLESYSRPGISLARHDNSAMFLGVLRDTADIRRVEFGTSTGRNFWINRASLLTESKGPPTAPIPEPTTAALFGIALVGFAARRKIMRAAS